MSLILSEQRDGVTLITLNRPEKRNALSIALRLALADAINEAAGDDDVRAVVLTGAPPAFCAGLDHTEFGGDDANRRALWDSTRAMYGAIRDVPVPIIAAVNGPAIGGGFVLAALCDLLVASRTAVFQHVGLKRGIPVSYGALLRVMPPQVARELAFTGRSIDAADALTIGVVRRLADDALAEGLALAGEVAAHPRRVLARTKQLVRAADEGSDAARASEAELAALHRALFERDPD